ncbi:MAG: hypothetical protein JXM73_11625 [Anaerolineae bacterium]|nr:hypothetical protein [Anaerolineae bacterium]
MTIGLVVDVQVRGGHAHVAPVARVHQRFERAADQQRALDGVLRNLVTITSA